MSLPNFELVMVGETEEDKSNLVAETGFPFPPELCSQDCDELPPLQLEELDIKDEELNDVDEQPETDSTSWLMSPCPSDNGQTAGADETFSDTEVTLKNPPRTTAKGTSKSVFYNVPRHSQKPPQQDNKLRIVQLQNVTQRQRRLNVQGENIQQSDVGFEPRASVLNILPIVSGPRRVPTMPNINVPQRSLLKANQASNDEILLSVPVHIIMQSNETMENINNSNNNEVSNQLSILISDQSENSQKNSVSPNTVHKNMNLTTITGKTICKQEHNVNLDPLAVDYHCMNCNEDLDNQLLLMFHECPDPKYKFHCKMCPKKFVSSKTLQNHIVTKHLNLNIVDNNVEDGPVIHLRRVEEWYSGKIYSPKLNLTCAVCKYVTTSKKSLKLHIKSHFKIKYFNCKFCEARFLIRFQLKMHCKKFHSTQVSQHKKKIISKKNTENKLYCKKCNIKLKTKLALQIHMKSHSDSPKAKPNFDHGKIVKKKYKCRICKKSFNSRSKIDDHIINAHDRQKIDKFCHQNINSGSDSESDSRFACKECDFKCTSKSELQNHVNFHLIFKFKCKHCGIFLMNESELDKHLKISHKSEENATLELSVHTEDNVATTNKVDNATSTNSRRQNITQYPCKYCGKIYVYSSTLEYHQKTQHKEECDAEKNPQKLAKYKILTKENQIKIIVRKARKQNLVLKEDKNVALETITVETENVTSQSPDYLNDNSNQDANSSGAENDDFQTEEVTDLSENYPDSSKTNDIEDISHDDKSNVDILGQLTVSSSLLINDNNKNYLITCRLCNKIYSTLNELCIHANKSHKITVLKLKCQKVSGQFQCNICGSRFKCKTALKNHELKHRGILPYQCKFCGRSFGHLGSVLAHNKSYKNNCSNKNDDSIENHNTNDDTIQLPGSKINIPFTCNQLYTCNICEIYFVSLSILYEHAQTIHSNNFVETKVRKGKGGKHKCNECSETFPKLKSLCQHKILHRGVKAFPCMFCTNIYSMYDGIHGHYRHAHSKLWKLSIKNKYEKIANLENCTYVFEGSYYVSLMNEDPNNPMIFNCHICNISFKTKSEIYKHCKEMHYDVRSTSKFFCLKCNEEFRSNKQFRLHRKFHQKKVNVVKIGPFYCDNCCEEFTSLVDLEKHITSSNCAHNTKSEASRISKCGSVNHNKRKKFEVTGTEIENSKRLKIVGIEFDGESRSSNSSFLASENQESAENKELNEEENFANEDKIDRDFSDNEDSEDESFNSESRSSNLKDKKLKSESANPILISRFDACVNYYECNLCKKKFSVLSEVYTHGEKYHEVTVRKLPYGSQARNGSFQCKVCDNSYSYLKLLRNHMLLHRNIRPYPCKYCGKYYSSSSNVIKHYKKSHTKLYNADNIKAKKLMEEKKITGKISNNIKKNENLKTKTNTSIFKNVNTFSQYHACSICKIYYSNIQYLYQHVQKHHSNNFVEFYVKSARTGPHKCDECADSFTKAFKLKHHKLKHRNILAFPCVFCTEICVQHPSLIYHYNKFHKSEWELHKQKYNESKISGPLTNVKRTFMFEGSKYITLTDINKKRLAFECNDCKLIFNTRDETLDHSRIKHSQFRNDENGDDTSQSSFRSFQTERKATHCCKYCREMFRSWRQLTIHYWSRHESQRLEEGKKKPLSILNKTLEAENVIEFHCNICKQKFDSHSKLLQHQHDIHSDSVTKNEKLFYCDDCRQEFTNYIVLKKHITSSACKCEIKSLELKTSEVETCQKTSLEGRNNSIAESSELNLFTCNHCNSSFDTKFKLKSHIKYHHKVNDPKILKFICKLCNKIFKSHSRVKKHLCTNVPRTYTCVVCKAIFESKHLYVIHKTTHEKSFICEICGDEFFTELQLKMHTIRRHEEHKFLCSLCGRKFPLLCSLNAHLKRHENIEYSCNKCDKKFFTLKQKQQHYNMVHGSVCLFCKTCSRSFSRKHHLDEHERMHAKTNKTYFCEFCNKTFISYAGHKVHVLNSHKFS